MILIHFRLPAHKTADGLRKMQKLRLDRLIFYQVLWMKEYSNKKNMGKNEKVWKNLNISSKLFWLLYLKALLFCTLPR